MVDFSKRLKLRLAVLKPYYGETDEQVVNFLLNEFIAENRDELQANVCRMKLQKVEEFLAKKDKLDFLLEFKGLGEFLEDD